MTVSNIGRLFALALVVLFARADASHAQARSRTDAAPVEDSEALDGARYCFTHAASLNAKEEDELLSFILDCKGDESLRLIAKYINYKPVVHPLLASREGDPAGDSICLGGRTPGAANRRRCPGPH